MDPNLLKILDAAAKSSKNEKDSVAEKYGLIESGNSKTADLDPNDPMVMMFEKMLAEDENKASGDKKEKGEEKQPKDIKQKSKLLQLQQINESQIELMKDENLNKEEIMKMIN